MMQTFLNRPKPSGDDANPSAGPVTKPHALIEARDYIFSKYIIRKNVLTLELEAINNETDLPEEVTDEFYNDLWFEMRTQGFNVSADAIVKIIHNRTHLQKTNPLQEYLESVEWDGTDHIGELAKTVNLSDSEDLREQVELWPEYLKRWLVASVACVLSGAVNQWCLVLNGGGGKGKSAWCNKLMPDYLNNYLFSGHIVPKNTDSSTCNFLAEKWIINLEDQLQGLTSTDYHEMKNIITVPNVTNRKAFHRMNPKRPRIASFIASVDDPSFLIGHNNRRWLVFTIDSINYQHKVDINQVWAQAVKTWRDGFRYWFNQEENERLNKINKIYHVIAMEEELLLQTFIPSEKNNSDSEHLSGSTIFNVLQEQTKRTLNAKLFNNALQANNFIRSSEWNTELKQPRYGYWVIKTKKPESHEE